MELEQPKARKDTDSSVRIFQSSFARSITFKMNFIRRLFVVKSFNRAIKR